MKNMNLNHFKYTGDGFSIRKSYSQDNDMRDYFFQFNGSISHKFEELSDSLQIESVEDLLILFEILFEFGLNELIEISKTNDKNGRIDRVKLFDQLPELKTNLLFF